MERSTIDTSFVASTDNSGGDGDDDAVPQTAAPGASSIDADDIVLYTETGGTILTDDAFPQWDWQTGTLAPLETGGDVGNVLKFSDLNFQGINLRSTDLSVKSSLTLDLWSEVAGKLKIYLANDAGAEEGYAEYGVIVEVDADQAGDWTTFNIPLTDFVGVDLTSVNQMRFDNQNNDGGVGDDTGLVTFYVDNMAFTGDPVSYDTVTLDYESGDTYGAVSFDGAADPVIETVSDAYGGAADTAALRVEKLTGDHVADWAGVKVIVAPTGANLVADPSAPIEMQVYSTVDGGSITVKLEGSGAPYQFPDSSGLSLGWNSVTVTPPAGLDAMNTLVIMPDLFGPQGNVYYVDEVSLTGVLMAEPDPVPQTAAPSASGLGADDVVLFTESNGDALHDTDPFPVWNEWQTSRISAVDGVGDIGTFLKFANLNYQGVNLDSTDLTGKEKLTLDIWSENPGKVKIYLVSRAGEEDADENSLAVEHGVIVEVGADQAGGWSTVNIPLDDFVGVDLSAVNQMRFDSQNNAGGVGDDTGLVTFYVDNMAFTNDVTEVPPNLLIDFEGASPLADVFGGAQAE